jgi:hypothetical protein
MITWIWYKLIYFHKYIINFINILKLLLIFSILVNHLKLILLKINKLDRELIGLELILFRNHIN